MPEDRKSEPILPPEDAPEETEPEEETPLEEEPSPDDPISPEDAPPEDEAEEANGLWAELVPPGASPEEDTHEVDGNGQLPYNKAVRGRGLYRYVKISLKNLNILIVVLVVALLVCMGIAVANRGFIITFDSQGGTPVESQKLMYGNHVVVDENPTREGYVFDGWFLDPYEGDLWDLENDKVTESMTLYAGWSEAQ